MDRKNGFKIFPSNEDWIEFIEDHNRFVSEELERDTSVLIEQADRFAKMPPFAMEMKAEIPKEKLPLPFIPPDNIDRKISGILEYEEKIKILDHYQTFPKSRLEICPVSIYWPPFDFGSPTQKKLTPSNNWYPTSSSLANPQTARIEIGVLADQKRSQKVVGNLGISEASAGVGITHILANIKKPSKITVQTRACVDATCQGLAAITGNVISSIFNLYLTITTSSQSVSPVGTTVYNKTIQSNWFNDKIDAQSYILKQSFEVSAPDYLIATLSAKATVMAHRFEEEYSWNDFAVIDAEGYSNPNGDYYPRAGSVFVSGFSVQVCPMP